MEIKTVKTVKYISDEGFSFTFLPVNGDVEVIKTKEGYDCKYLVQDENYPSPDEDGDNALFLVGYHRDFTVKNDKIITKQQCINLFEDEKNLDEDDAEWVKEFKSKYFIFALEAYIHSGAVLALSREGNFPDRQWDVSQLGACFALKSEFNTIEKAKKACLGLIETWNCSLSGDVYGIVREHYNKDKEQLDFDAVWGFYGYKYAQEALKTEI